MSLFFVNFLTNSFHRVFRWEKRDITQPHWVDRRRECGHRQNSPRAFHRSLISNLLIIPVALIVSGCGPNSAKSTKKDSDSATKPAKSAEVVAQELSDDILASAVYQLRPENYGINSAVDKPINLLNSWRFKQTETLGSVDVPLAISAPQSWISPEEETRLAQAKFDAMDAVHIRDAMFHRVVSGYLSDRGRDELQRVGIVVDFVCRNVSPWKTDEIELPLVPYWILQFGHGTAEDRAWLTSEILRQLRIDSVIVRAKSDVKGTTDKWLLGVLIEKQVYLYDLRLGLPIFSGSESNGLVATLSEVVNHPEWLEQMASTGPYVLSVDDLRDPTVFVMTLPNYWCKRMQQLEHVLPAENACVLYDPVIDEDGRSGLLQRIATGGGWSVDHLTLWKYPRHQIEEMNHQHQEKMQEMQRLSVVFEVPIPITYDKERKPKAGVPERKMLRFRSDQLLGKFAEATTKYLRIRHLEVEENPAEVQQLNRMAAEDAFYWTGLCKFELGEYDTAIELLTEYIKKHDRKGKWFYSARSLLAQCYAKQDRFPEAITILERGSSDDPYREGNAVRLKRYKALMSK